MHVLDRRLASKLRELIGQEATIQVEQLASGSATSMEDYRDRCGYIRGLDTVREWIKGILEAEHLPDEEKR